MPEAGPGAAGGGSLRGVGAAELCRSRAVRDLACDVFVGFDDRGLGAPGVQHLFPASPTPQGVL